MRIALIRCWIANGISLDDCRECGMNVVFGKRVEYSDEHFIARADKHGNLQLRFKRWGFAAKGECPVSACPVDSGNG